MAKIKEADSVPNILPLAKPWLQHHAAILNALLTDWKKTGQVTPVLLLTGIAGTGKRELAYYLSQWIFCEKSGVNSIDQAELGIPWAPSCGQCQSCRRAQQGSWVDFTEVLPEVTSENSENGTLKVEQFRKLKSSLGFGAHEGRYRITLIPRIERMTPQAANSLLKVLEEPPPGWIFFLTASDSTLALPTLVSRCQRIRVSPLGAPLLAELLKTAPEQIPSDRMELCARLAGGSYSRALTWASDSHWEKRKNLLELFNRPMNVISSLVEWGSQEPKNWESLADQLELFVADLLRWNLQEGHSWLNDDGARELLEHAKAVTAARGTRAAREFWLARAERLARARVEARAPVNRKLLIQDVLLPWLGAGVQ